MLSIFSGFSSMEKDRPYGEDRDNPLAVGIEELRTGDNLERNKSLSQRFGDYDDSDEEDPKATNGFIPVL